MYNFCLQLNWLRITEITLTTSYPGAPKQKVPIFSTLLKATLHNVVTGRITIKKPGEKRTVFGFTTKLPFITTCYLPLRSAVWNGFIILYTLITIQWGNLANQVSKNNSDYKNWFHYFTSVPEKSKHSYLYNSNFFSFLSWHTIFVF